MYEREWLHAHPSCYIVAAITMVITDIDSVRAFSLEV
jgi:hypothetical protein